MPKPKKKKDKKEDAKAQEEGGVDVIPVFGGVMVASVLGGPVVLIAGLKLGMFAAIGGGIMGYTTGKMFSDHGYTSVYITVLTSYLTGSKKPRSKEDILNSMGIFPKT